MSDGKCNKEGGQYRDQDHDCYCAVPKAEKHSVHQCQCGAGWIDPRWRNR